MISEYIVAGALAVLAIVHSTLGERELLQPLFRQAWDVGEPRWGVERVLRFAWHLTSVAWLALAAIVLGVPTLPVVAVFSVISAAMIFVMLRAHLAWPIFLLAGLAAVQADGQLDVTTLRAGAVAAAVVMVMAALLHLYWALGGRWMFDVAVPPSATGDQAFQPGPVLTAAVAVALVVFALLTLAVAWNLGPDLLRAVAWCGVAVLVVRAVGDAKTAGFSKTDRSSAFAQADDRWFTPIIVFLAFGVSAAALVGV